MNEPNLTVLRNMLEELAIDDRLYSKQEIVSIAFAFRDCRLELIRMGEDFTKEQLHRLLQMQYRLDMVAEGQGAAEGIPNEANRALAAFNWTVNHN